MSFGSQRSFISFLSHVKIACHKMLLLFASKNWRIASRRCRRCSGDRVLFPTVMSDASIPPGPTRICPCDGSVSTPTLLAPGPLSPAPPSSSAACLFGLNRELLRAGIALVRESARLTVLKEEISGERARRATRTVCDKGETRVVIRKLSRKLSRCSIPY